MPPLRGGLPSSAPTTARFARLKSRTPPPDPGPTRPSLPNTLLKEMYEFLPSYLSFCELESQPTATHLTFPQLSLFSGPQRPKFKKKVALVDHKIKTTTNPAQKPREPTNDRNQTLKSRVCSNVVSWLGHMARADRKTVSIDTRPTEPRLHLAFDGHSNRYRDAT